MSSSHERRVSRSKQASKHRAVDTDRRQEHVSSLSNSYKKNDYMIQEEEESHTDGSSLSQGSESITTSSSQEEYMIPSAVHAVSKRHEAQKKHAVYQRKYASQSLSQAIKEYMTGADGNNTNNTTTTTPVTCWSKKIAMAIVFVLLLFKYTALFSLEYNAIFYNTTALNMTTGNGTCCLSAPYRPVLGDSILGDFEFPIDVNNNDPVDAGLEHRFLQQFASSVHHQGIVFKKKISHLILVQESFAKHDENKPQVLQFVNRAASSELFNRDIKEFKHEEETLADSIATTQQKKSCHHICNPSGCSIQCSLPCSYYGTNYVCAVDVYGNGVTYRNRCYAQRARNIAFILPGPCPPDTCICTMEYNPVCGTFANGTRVTFSNPCVARCNHVVRIDPGPCPDPAPTCNCPGIFDPVCGQFANGTTRTFINNCTRQCFNATFLNNGACNLVNNACPLSYFRDILGANFVLFEPNVRCNRECTWRVFNSSLRVDTLCRPRDCKITPMACRTIRILYETNAQFRERLNCVIRSQTRAIRGGTCDFFARTLQLFGQDWSRCFIPSIRMACMANV